MNKIAQSQNSNDPNHDPEDIENGMGLVPFENRAPGKEDCIRSVEYPHEHKRAGRSQPTDETETENTHQHTNHFQTTDILYGECVDKSYFFLLE